MADEENNLDPQPEADLISNPESIPDADQNLSDGEAGEQNPLSDDTEAVPSSSDETEAKSLSSDEMEALLDVAAPDENEPVDVDEAAKIQVHSYNFRQPGRLSGSQLRALKVVHEYYAKRFSEDRPGGIDLSFDLNLLSIETVSFANFMGSLGNPCFLAELSSRFDQPVLMEIDLPVAHLLVSSILGEAESEDEESSQPVKALTSIEQGIASSWLDNVLPILSEAWELSAPVRFGLKCIDSDPRFVQVMPDDNPVVSMTFRFQAGSTVGQMTLCYPLEPLQELLEGMSLKMSGGDDEDGESEQGGARIMSALKVVPLELGAELGCCSIRANQLATLKQGDVLCLDRSIFDPVDLLLGSNRVFQAYLGRRGDNLALQLVKRCNNG